MKKYMILFVLSGAVMMFSTSFLNMRHQMPRDKESRAFTNARHDVPRQGATKYLPGRIIIKLKKGCGDFSLMQGKISLGIPSLDEKLSKYEVYQMNKRFTFNRNNLRDGVPDLSRIYRIDFPGKYTVTEAVRAFSSDPCVEYAEPMPLYYLCEVPNDSLYDQMYHLPRIMAEQAWDIHHGEDGAEVLIGIVDDGAEWRHIDLVGNVWQNIGEDADGDGHVIQVTFPAGEWIFDPGDENGVDDDGNGKVDDFVGWDFINEYGGQDNDPTPNMISMDHGTHCTGLAAGRTNNGHLIASISWNVRFVVAKVDNDDDGIDDYDAYEALVYLAELGADIISNSFAYGEFVQSDYEALEYARSLGCIIVAAAANEADEVLRYPASYPGVISVAATGPTDLKPWWSSFGIGVDICAPGLEILSLVNNNLAGYSSGTSMSTPLAAGLVALVKSYHPDWSNEMIINQVAGTCDDIDSLQPGFSNKLGYGRINAFRALSDTNVVTQQELRLVKHHGSFSGEDGDGIFEPGEMVTMGFTMQNFAIGLDTVPVTFTLSTSNPEVAIINGEYILDVPSDALVTADSAFTFQVANDLDSAALILLTLSAESALPIPLGNEWTFELPVNQSGLLVFNGDGQGNAYSGEYIRNYLLENTPYQVLYTQQFPLSLTGFDAVFLSFGNYGAILDQGTIITYEMSLTIAEYLYTGGRLYEDCGSFFGCLNYYNYPNLEEMEVLFSIDTFFSSPGANYINLLTGLPGSVAEGLVFTRSHQSPNFYIDNLTPDSNGMAVFEEDGYGIVAVQGEGEYGQRTFCFSYSLAHLLDGDQGTREELLSRIVDWLLMGVGTDEFQVPGSNFQVEVWPNPADRIVDCQLSIVDFQRISLKIFDLYGREVKVLVDEARSPGEYSVRVDVSALPAGVYLVRLQGGGESSVRKLVVR